jgi:MtrB/PioB family decaheme-associated outer membrane protein
MTNNEHRKGIGSSRKILFLALLAAFGPAQAADEDVAAAINPNTAWASAGVGWSSGDSSDRAFFGQYNGLRTQDVNALLDFLYIRRTDDGLWTRSFGRNLGLDVLDVGFGQEKQGDWKYWLEYDQMVRRDPYTINTGVLGFGSTTPSILNSLAAPGTGGDIDLSQKRKGITLGVSKWLAPNISFEANYKYEDKKGSRVFGVGNYCSDTISPVCVGANGTVGALYLTPEPINSTTQQFEAKLSFSGEMAGLTIGYYGSFYDNSNGVLTPVFPNGASTITNTGDALGPLAALLAQPVALPPNSHANQLFASGYVALPLNTRINAKVTYTNAVQDASFPSQLLVGAAPGPSSLYGEMNTTLAYVGLTSRPLPKLSINGNVRWEDKSNHTNLGNYVVDPGGTVYTNWPASGNVGSAKLEAGYQVTGVDRVTLGGDLARVNRDRPVSSTWIPPNSMAAMRETTNEWGVYAEWRRSMSETLNAALQYRYSDRDGWHWYVLDQAQGFPFVSYGSLGSSTGIFPATMLNRERNAAKLTADWTPTDALSFNLSAEGGRDRFNGPAQGGLHDTDFQLYNVDASLRLSANWKMTAYASWGKQSLDMQQGLGYIAALEQESTAVGLGITGTIKPGLNVGGDVSYLDDKNSYNLSMTTGAAVPNLPDNSYRATILKLWGTFALDKKSDVRLDLVQQWADYNDWTWGYNGVPFTYSDNTTLSIQPTQNVTFLGVRYIYKFN